MLKFSTKAFVLLVSALLSQVHGENQQSSAFPVDLREVICPDLSVGIVYDLGISQVPKSRIRSVMPNATACEMVCQKDPICKAWQYCSTGSCPLFDGTMTPQNYIRCYLSNSTAVAKISSTSGSTRERCIPGPKDNKWIGGAKADWDMVSWSEKKDYPVSRKRGFTGNLFMTPENDTQARLFDPVCGDAEALGLENSWYYTWQIKTSSKNHCRDIEKLWGVGPNENGPQMGGEFVPMIIAVGKASKVLKEIKSVRAEWKRSNVHYLLGYNEPDPKLDHLEPDEPRIMVDAATAAQDWLLVQDIAASFDPPLTLVSPAPSSQDFDEDGRSGWLDEFFGNCTHVVEGCKPELIQYIAFHDFVGDVNKLERRINGMAKHYKRPLWLTAYSMTRLDPTPLRQEQDEYMKESLTMLENHPDVFRYVWVHSRNKPTQWGGEKDLLQWNVEEPTLTSTGEIYKTWPEQPNLLTDYQPATTFGARRTCCLSELADELKLKCACWEDVPEKEDKTDLELNDMDAKKKKKKKGFKDVESAAAAPSTNYQSVRLLIGISGALLLSLV